MHESLHFFPAIDMPDLVAQSVTTLLKDWQGLVPVKEIWVAEIDPKAAGGKEFCKRYGIQERAGANCVIVEGVRNGKHTLSLYF